MDFLLRLLAHSEFSVASQCMHARRQGILRKNNNNERKQSKSAAVQQQPKCYQEQE